jgi:hypothetical protein
MRRYLVVAHQTLGSPELLEAMRDPLAEGPARSIWWCPSTTVAG